MTPRHEQMSSKGEKLHREWSGPPKGSMWAWYTVEMLESPAWRALTHNAFRVVERLLVEFCRNRCRGNGNLIVTHDQFAEWGIRRQSIADAIAVAEALGFVRTTYRGGRSVSDFHFPSRYALTFRPSEAKEDGRPPIPVPATNEWKAVETDEMAAERIAAAKSELAAIRSAKTKKQRRPSFATAKSSPSIAPV